MKCIVIGIAGGSGSGKTTVVRQLRAELGQQSALLEQDAYYRDRSDLPFQARADLNYDHPAAMDEELLVEHLKALRSGVAVDAPRYDFALHARGPEVVRVEPRPCVLVEGILVLASSRIRELLDLRIFVETAPDIRFIRRLERDIRERGRTVEGVVAQWGATVRPMHQEFVEPSREHADLILPGGGSPAALRVLLDHLRLRGS